MSSDSTSKFSPSIIETFEKKLPWQRFDEWTGICIELPEGFVSSPHAGYVCAFFGAAQDHEFKLVILRGLDPARGYLKYRNEEWIPEFGLDFGTIDSIQVYIDQDQVSGYESLKPGRPAEDLRSDEKQLMFMVLEAIVGLVETIDQDKIPMLGETDGVIYYLWKVLKNWKVDVREVPDEKYIPYSSISFSQDRLKRLQAVKLPREGVWEAAYFYLPVTRFQGDQEVFVQCAGVAERGVGLLGLVTLEAHADPDVELAEALVGSIEKQGRLPQFLVVKEEAAAEKLLPLLQTLNIHLRLRRKLPELDHVRDQMIEQFPDEAASEDQ